MTNRPAHAETWRGKVKPITAAWQRDYTRFQVGQQNGACDMLSLRQIDDIVQFVFYTTPIELKLKIDERLEQGGSILYSVSIDTDAGKLLLGKYRVWEWTDGSGRSGWVHSDDDNPEIKKYRSRIWEIIVIMVRNAENEAAKAGPVAAPAGSEKVNNVKTATVQTVAEPGKYDELCKRWVNRSDIPYQNKTEFLSEYAPELLLKTFDRILSDAYRRGVIDKTPGKHGRYKPKI